MMFPRPDEYFEISKTKTASQFLEDADFAMSKDDFESFKRSLNTMLMCGKIMIYSESFSYCKILRGIFCSLVSKPDLLKYGLELVKYSNFILRPYLAYYETLESILMDLCSSSKITCEQIILLRQFMKRLPVKRMIDGLNHAGMIEIHHLVYANNSGYQPLIEITNILIHYKQYLADCFSNRPAKNLEYPLSDCRYRAAIVAAMFDRWADYQRFYELDIDPKKHISNYSIFMKSAEHIQRSWRRYKDRKLKQTLARIAHSKNLSPEIAQVIYAHILSKN